MHSLTDLRIARHALLVLMLLAACDDASGYPPVARIAFTPGSIDENDGFQTPVVLDGTGSADPIDDPAGERSLRYRWKIVGDEFRIVDGSLAEARVTLTFLGETPATILLTVTDGDDDSNTARENLQLTVRP
jgi:hypothetical protein